MRLEDMLKNVSGITNRVIKENCWEGQFNVLEGIQVLQSKINEIILAINNGIIKGDKGDTPNVQVGETTTLDPGNKASVTQTGDMLNPIFNFAIPKGEKGDKGDTGKASESIQDNVVGLDTCWSSQKTVGYVDNMFNSLQDVKGIKYATDKEYLVANGSKNGVVKDLKISGRTLKNYFRFRTQGVVTTNIYIYSHEGVNNNTTGGKTLRVFNDTGKQIIVDINSNGVYKRSEILRVTDLYKDIVTTVDEYIYCIYGQSKDGWNSESDSDKKLLKDMCILIDDLSITTKPLYFEGIASVGNGNEIEVLSRNQNKIDFISIDSNGLIVLRNKLYKGYITNYSNDKIGLIIRNPDTSWVKDVNLEKGKTIDLSKILLEGQYIQSIWKLSTNINMSNYKGLVHYNVDFIQDKKPILFKDTYGTWKPVTELRGVDTNSCDTIEQHSDGKHYLHVRTEKLVLNGGSNENWVKSPSERPNHCIFVLNGVNVKLYSKCLSSRFNYDKMIWEKDNQGVTVGDKRLDYFVHNTINTLELWKQNLQQNNETVIILRDNELVYEVNPLEVESFENETMILFKYGVVNGTSEFYFDSNLGSITLDNMQRISRIENEIYQVKKVVLNGDYRALAQSTYPEDFKEVLKHE